MSGWKNRIAGWFIDREFFMRANGQVRFLKLSAQLQRRVAGTVASVVGLWLVVTLGMATNQLSVSAQRMALSEQEAKVESAEERVANYRGSIDEVAKDLERRQKMLESLSDQYLGEVPEAKAQAPATAKSTDEDKTVKTISAVVPEAAGLARVEVRQIQFAEKMTKVALARTSKAEAAIRQFGLNPDVLARQARSAQGGVFEPFFGSAKKDVRDPRFLKLAASLSRMDAMERALAAIPTSMPAAVMMMSSGFGFRSDPFTGGGAMHAGLDFKGPVGTPILSAAEGRVTFAGYNGGYGKTVEITHANGLLTRYAHLSGVHVTRGQMVHRGLQIGRMGSTGRSTGSHLHFEVRLNGRAINPRKFLEANPDVLKVQTVAGNRAGNAAKEL
ncbi:MAG TPA: M23 family metallopeptidase [Sphingorhabdus sp.]|jgi:murein DD-endopeptidase MepM/ murein hydrolase activator NlpD|uniref:M23 family metallopeptidase n=1 Tax=Sphingorhabdus sp. TaxID=1902408 RepID=UPI0026B12904|nr:M23 family metallopeptidase [Sphingorhabdus sp.]HQS12555.1 M23 family metallopeptidase [Sphingorhabdus sp.]HQS79897.1 M23 family metallopeptidase [Sphingorhabdus sp.]